MKDKYIIIIGTVLIIAFIIWQQHLIRDNPKDNYSELILKKMDNLEKQLKSLSEKKDSTKMIIIKLDKDLEHNRKQYDEMVNNILIQPDSANREFIDSYIKQYIERITKE